ncbi:MAG: hypothetical protein ACI9MC_000796 [Kiritimatiellia bacterium]|jgi:hypothetical protein
MARTPLLLCLLALPGVALADDGAFVEPTLLLQLWGTAYDMDETAQADPVSYGDPEHDPGLSLRRGRLGVRGGIDRADFQVDFGLSQPYDGVSDGRAPQIEVANAFVRSSWFLGGGRHSVSAGFLKLPFGRERIMSSKDLVFQERSVASAYMSPGQQLGVLWRLEPAESLSVEVGAFNGGGDVYGDDNMGLLLGGRVAWDSGSTYVTFGEGNGLGLGLGGYWNDDLATDTFAGEVDALLRFDRLSVYLEGSLAVVKPANTSIALPDVASQTGRMGLTAQVSYWVPVDDDDSVDAVARSAVEIAARISTYDDHTKLKNNGDVAIAHVGATWRNVAPAIDLGAGYVLRVETQGRSYANDTVRLWAQVQWPKPKADQWDPLKHSAGAAPALPVDVHPTGDR